MSILPLRLGPLVADGYVVRHSGIRWLRPDGHVCRAREIVAFANIGLLRTAAAPREQPPFAGEARDFQVAFAAPAGGVLRHARDSSAGGYLDLMETTQHWAAETVIGHIEHPDPGSVADDALPLLMLAGRRMTELAEVRTGLLTGWHSRARAWWGETPATGGTFPTVLSMGICDLFGVVRGEGAAFLEMFAAMPGPVQILYHPDEVLVPCSVVATEQLRRTPAQSGAIAADLAQGLLAGATVPRPADWLFAGSLLQALDAAPMTEPTRVLTRTGLHKAPPPATVLLSVRAEPGHLLRHRKLGYSLVIFRTDDAGPAIREWLQRTFEPVRRSIDDIAADYATLFAAARARGPTDFLILNAMSSNGAEDVHDYAAFDLPLGGTLATIRAKELNLMLHDLARAHGVAIVDADALAADLGGAVHLADGVHQSGPLQAATRAEVVRLLAERGLGGVAAAPRQPEAVAS